MKRLLQAVIFVAVSILLVWILKQAFPKNAGFLNIFLILLLLDAFLWVMTKTRFRSFRPAVKYTITIFYWLPMALVIAGVVYGFFRSFYDWPVFLRAWLTSFIFIAYLSKLLPVIFILLKLVFQGFMKLIFRIRKVRRPVTRDARFFIVTGWATGLAVFFLLLAGMVFWEHSFRIRKVEVALEGLPSAFEGLRIVQISDLHLGSWNPESKLEELAGMINNLEPDLVFFTGDICNYSTDEVWPFQHILGQITAREGVFAILGNHDYGEYRHWPSAEAKQENMEDLYRFFREMGWNLLLNENEIIHRGPDSLAVIGVENWGSTSRFQRLADMPKALEGTEGMAARLLLSHDPSHWDSIVSKQYPEIPLTFSGHTHGGQVGFESRDGGWSLARYIYPRWAGLYSKDHSRYPTQYLYVNRGAGTIGYTGRIGIWAEVTLVVLRSSYQL